VKVLLVMSMVLFIELLCKSPVAVFWVTTYAKSEKMDDSR